MGGRPNGPSGELDRRLCQVGGLNLNYRSGSGAMYHVQIEDRGPVLDALTDKEVRRVNVIVYANYGEANARIIHGRDHDFADLRSAAYNREIEGHVQELAAGSRRIIDEWEAQQADRIKALLRAYNRTRDEQAKREFEAANALHPFVFSRAWRELKQQRARGPVEEPGAAAPETAVRVSAEAIYPLDAEARDLVLEIQKAIGELEADLRRLRSLGADANLRQKCGTLIARARQTLAVRSPSEFDERRLKATRGSLLATLRQLRARLAARSEATPR